MSLAVIQAGALCPVERVCCYGASDASQVLRGCWHDLFVNRQRSNTLATTSTALYLIDGIGERCREFNWDGEGADAVTGDVLDEAMKIAAMLPASFPFPEIEADPDGSITFVWRPRRNHVFLASVYGKRHLVYAGFSGSRSEVHGTEIIGSSLPAVVTNFLQTLYL